MNADKEKAKALPPQQQRVMLALMEGGKHSTVDLCRSLYVADPRANIAVLRAKGFNILDEWRQTPAGSRYKVYFYKQVDF